MLFIGCLIAWLVVCLVVVVFLDLVPFELIETGIKLIFTLLIFAVIMGLHAVVT